MFSIRLTGVDLSDPVMIRAALFWTRFILSKLVWLDKDQADMPYSSTGLTLLTPPYSLFKTFISAPHVLPANFLMIPRRSFALGCALFI
jgi:hypothetical protein